MYAAFYSIRKTGKDFLDWSKSVAEPNTFCFCFWQLALFQILKRLPFRIFFAFGGDGNDASVRVISY